MSPFVYLLHNKRKTGIVCIILTITVFSIYFISVIINSIYETSEKVNVSPFLYFSIAECPDDTDYISTESISTINTISDVQKSYRTIISTISIDTVFGTTASYIFFINESNELLQAMTQLNLSIKEGRLPEHSKYEVVLHENVLKNKKLNVGDRLGDYDIVGTLSGETQISFGSYSKTTAMMESYDKVGVALSLLLIPEANTTEAMNKTIGEIELDDIKFYDYNEAKSNLSEEFENINLIFSIIIVLISISLSIAVAALMYSFYSNRYDEFGILHAIGYSKKQIQLKVLKEIFIMIGFSWMLGMILSSVGLMLFKNTIYVSMGQEMSLFVLMGVSFTLISPLLIICCTLIPVSFKLYRSDLVSVIERR